MEERALERAKAKQEREEKKRQQEQQKVVSTLSSDVVYWSCPIYDKEYIIPILLT